MEREEKTDFTPLDRKLIFALFLAAIGWILHLNVSYLLMPQSCENGSKSILHVVTLVCLAITAAGGLLAWRERARWMGMMIAVFAMVLLLVIVAQEIPNLILRSCD